MSKARAFVRKDTLHIRTHAPVRIEANDDGQIVVYHQRECMTYCYIEFGNEPRVSIGDSSRSYLDEQDVRELSICLAVAADLVRDIARMGPDVLWQAEDIRCS